MSGKTGNQGEHRFEPIGTGRNFELVIRAIQKAIVHGDLQPGQRLPPEQELADQFGVSRSALREALKVLELSGALDVRRGYGGGTFVTALPAEEFTTVQGPHIPSLAVSRRHLVEVRQAIEPVAARLAVDAPFRELLVVHETIRRIKSFDDRPAHLITAVVEFHVAVAKASRNPVFVSVLEALRPVLHRAMGKLARDPQWVEACVTEHEALLKEIEGGDGERAEQAMRQHLVGGDDHS